MTVAGVRADGSLGLRRYCERLQASLATIGIDYQPGQRPLPANPAHWHFANSSRAAIWLTASASRPLLLTVHDVRPRTRALKPAYRGIVHPRLYRRASAVVVHSRFAADMLIADAGVGGHRVRIIPHPASPLPDVARVEARRLLGWPEDARIAVIPGVVKRAKLIEEILSATETLVRQRRWQLALVGRAADERLARSARAAGALVITDPDDHTYSCAISAADAILVLRADSVGESNGPLLDALGAGKAVLASCSGSIPEVVGDAALLTPATTAGIRRGLEALEDETVRLELEQNACARRTELSWESAAELHAELFAEALGA